MKNIDKQLSYAPAEVHISYCGFASPAMQQMQNMLKKQITLLCYEKSADFCHRQLVSKWLQEYNISCSEYNYNSQKTHKKGDDFSCPQNLTL